VAATVGEDAADLLLIGPRPGSLEPLICVRRLREARLELPVLVLATPGGLENALELQKAGADEVLPADTPPARIAEKLRFLERGQELQRLRREVEELAGRSRELESLVYLISHDLWTPIVSIQGISSILLEGDTGLQGRPLELAGRIQANAERIEELVRDLMDFPKIGRLVGALEPVHSGEIVERSLEGLAERIEESGAAIEVEEGLPEVVADRKRLRQVFHNLIDNAVKYGGEPPRIEVGHRLEEGFHLFWVRDNGTGISPDDQEKAFHLFQRVGEQKSRRQGMGIGLAVVRQIVERHGGKIWCESTSGSGATFYFTIPQRSAPDPVETLILQ
jgi:signal transduction histidine kinase